MDKLRLEYVMKVHGDTAGDLAMYLGITRGTFSLKINERNTCFTQSEIAAIKEKYGLTAEETGQIFFADKVSKKDTSKAVTV